jgi:hypothetical protein
VEYSTVSRTKGATDEKRCEAREARHGGLRAIAGEERMLGTLVRVIRLDK